jgi:hypothetical protein
LKGEYFVSFLGILDRRLSAGEGLVRFFYDLNQKIYGLVNENGKFVGEKIQSINFRDLDKIVKKECVINEISPWFDLITNREGYDYPKYKNDIGLDHIFISARFDKIADCYVIKTRIMLGTDMIAIEDYTVEELKEIFGISAEEGNGEIERFS